jgi:hypothetical protein
MEVVAAAASTDGVAVFLIAGQPYRATMVMTSKTETAPTIATMPRRHRRGETIGMRDAGGSPTASVSSAYTRTGRAMFLTLCSPLSLNG